jgi:nitrogen-specific signal transduction histidine kinase
MSKIAALNINPSWDASDVIKVLTSNVELFIFSYSPISKSLLTWSDNAEIVLGVKDSNIAKDGNLFLRHVHPDDRFLLMSDLENTLKNKSSIYRATYRWIRPDNKELRWLHCRACMSSNETFEGIIVDLSPEFTGQVAKIAEPDSINAVLAAFPTMVFTVDAELRILRINRPAEMLFFNFGDNSFILDNFRIGRPLLDCFSNQFHRLEFKTILEELIEGKRSFHRQRVAIEDSIYNLEISPLVNSAVISGLLFIVSDVSEIISLEREIANLNKQEGLTRIAEGVAHNLNNSLQNIIAQASEILSAPNSLELVQKNSQGIIDTVQRSSELFKQLFAFDSQAKDLLIPVDINLASMTAANKLEKLFASNIKLSVAFGTPQPVLASQERLVQAIIEILKNAKESMPNGGTLSIRTYQVYLNDQEVPGLKAGSYAKLSISDNGPGMSFEEKQRCIEPYYTTKEQDAIFGIKKESGLGLSKAFSIARDFSGMLQIESKTGFGTTVSMYLPVNSETNKNKDIIDNKFNAKPLVLVVDDDLVVLKTVKQLLDQANLPCIVAEEPRRALALLNRFKNDLKIVLLDVVLPGMDGASLLRRIKRIAPNIKAIGFSGAMESQITELKNAGAVEVIRKPVDPKILQKTVEEVIK